MIAVYDLGPAPAPRFGARDYVGAITLGSAVVGSALSPDGRYLYVTSEVARQSPAQVRATTARASDRLLAFSTARLLSEPARALLAAVKVGTAPVGVAVFDYGKRVTVADSNRFNAPGSHAAVTIVNTTAVLAHRAAAVATLRAGQFPRELAVERDDSVVLVSNFASDQLGAVNVSRLR